MVGSFHRIAATVCAILVAASPAAAFGGRFAHRATYASPYTPIPVCYYFVPMVAPVWVCPMPAHFPATMPKVRSLAEPLPAPASRTAEPPLNSMRAPAITESRSFGGVVPAQAVQVAPGRCKVGFWNITGDDVTLTIDGQPRTLAKDQAVTLELDRTFVWQVGGRSVQTERVPAGQNLFEVILRP